MPPFKRVALCASTPPDTNILPAGIRLNVTAACSSIRPPSLPSPPRIVRYNDKRDNLNLLPSSVRNNRSHRRGRLIMRDRIGNDIRRG